MQWPVFWYLSGKDVTDEGFVEQLISIFSLIIYAKIWRMQRFVFRVQTNKLSILIESQLLHSF